MVPLVFHDWDPDVALFFLWLRHRDSSYKVHRSLAGRWFSERKAGCLPFNFNGAEAEEGEGEGTNRTLA